MDAAPIYNKIGTGYNTTRRADPYIAGRMMALLQPHSQGQYLDVGCGTGNYLQVFAKQYDFYGVEPSDTMLEVAKSKCKGVPIVQAKAEQLPFDDSFFDGATAMFTLHHWDDCAAGIREISRVLKPDGTVVFLSFTPKQILSYWLNHYFPQMMKLSAAVVPEETDMITMLHNAGFAKVETEKYFVHDDLQDHFLYSNKHRPEQYLLPEVRNGASSFTAFSTPEEVEQGLAQLAADIDDGRINEVVKMYENDFGDYMFFKVVKG